MKKIDIKTIELKIDKAALINAVNADKEFVIDIDGSICSEDESKITIFRYQDRQNDKTTDPDTMIKTIFKEFKPFVGENEVKIKPLMAWQSVMNLNVSKALYTDHQSDGIEVFGDSEIEDYGWHGVACDISYRDIGNFIEENCDGAIVFYDNEISFSGFVIVDEINDTREKVNSFLRDTIKGKLDNKELDLDDPDVEEALEFFNLDD